MTWFSAGVQTNPATDAILADTGPLSGAGSGRIKVVLGATIAAVCTLERRNAANSANISAQVIACLANDPFELEVPGESWADQERYRVRLNAVIVGSAQASIFLF